MLETSRPVARSFFDWAAESIPGNADGPLVYQGFRVSYKSFSRSTDF